MVNRFAGAQDSSSRRRRQMAQNSPTDSQALDAEILAEFSSDGNVPPAPSEDDDSVDFVRWLIPHPIWMHVLAIGVVTMLIVGMLWTLLRPADPSTLPRVDIIDCCRNVAGLLLLFAGQLSLLIGFQRSQSDLDFRGHYRWWNWLACGLMVLAVLLISDLLPLVPTAIYAFVESLTGPVQSARRTLVFIPATVCLVLFVSRIVPDMSRSRWSQSILVAGLLTFVVRQMLLVSNPEQTTAQVSSLLLLGSTFLVFSAMLLHARFVTYVNNDPPQHNAMPLEGKEVSIPTQVRLVQEDDELAEGRQNEKRNAPSKNPPKKSGGKSKRRKRRAA